MELTAFGQTDVGQVRPHNEDSILLEPSLQLYAVADGMGGHKGGECASRICLDTLRDYLQMAARGHAPLVGEADTAHSEAANLLGSAVRFANRAVFEAAFSKPEWRGMGTTIVALTVADNRVAIAHVGDSRAYLLRQGKFQQLTQDHSWIEEQVRAGLMSRDEALFAKGRNVLTRAIGQEETVQVDLDELELQTGDTLLLCSDGLFGMVADEEIAALIGVARNPEEACRELVACANGRGGRDNISVILLTAGEGKGLLAGMRRLFTKG
ncbi:Stp1/IreP family PP2C-type Ser/Thr phosphatase [Trichlorobacter lovleyi]|uniref:Protein serine/threonine phosphatase n=1 Tax=Trichlorobacter lovleyi (strain ATCC BAA-1151 / DSM 17278 / SZ) TaxID=398767 RepID=B3E9M8_TRIL1|nr:Stp1/IreP family PP2C-type Ser/Thr phosphatase [Trichlorobacter lovleyi]ACD95304.1 protein serine/threonine phosphatase [Trichlorobacter lovleyi SZ]